MNVRDLDKEDLTYRCYGGACCPQLHLQHFFRFLLKTSKVL